MDHRQAWVEQEVRTILETGVSAADANDFEACVRSLDEAVAVYESNPSYVRAPSSHFHSLVLFVDAARGVSEELGQEVNVVRKLSGRLDALSQTIH